MASPRILSEKTLVPITFVIAIASIIFMSGVVYTKVNAQEIRLGAVEETVAGIPERLGNIEGKLDILIKR